MTCNLVAGNSKPIMTSFFFQAIYRLSPLMRVRKVISGLDSTGIGKQGKHMRRCTDCCDMTKAIRNEFSSGKNKRNLRRTIKSMRNT